MSTRSHQVSIVVSSILFSCIAITVVGLRLFARLVLIRNAKVDDAVLFISLLAMLTFTAFVCAQLPYGLGAPISTVDKNKIPMILKLLWISIIAYNVSLAATKTSILLQYLRFMPTERSRAICWVMIFISISYGIVAVVDTIFQCRPISGFWYISRAKYCLKKEVLWLTHSGLNALTDIIIFIIPVPVLLELTMPRRQKFGLIFIFTIGALSTVMTFLRLNSLIIASKSPDITLNNTFAAIWSNAEITTAIVCASLPGIKPIITKVSPRESSSSPPPSNVPGSSGALRPIPLLSGSTFPGKTLEEANFELRTYDNYEKSGSQDINTRTVTHTV